MRDRARSQEATRDRIVQAAMELHEEIGPRLTTISGIAERAGVQRLTVYRHFSDETAIFQACTSHWLELNPPPGPEIWENIEDKPERLNAALGAFFDYYKKTERMWSLSHRDVTLVPALQAPMREFSESHDMLADQLASELAGPDDGNKFLRTTLRHALRFTTWRSLEEQLPDNSEKVQIVDHWISGFLSQQ
ncbi:MAG: TetR/AcrR family transcriptional regulator [Sneathiella sp.]|nr:TetR/AcrR family transcriptional regulator [Sneathiella sp.]